jgi:hypothetical protein
VRNRIKHGESMTKTISVSEMLDKRANGGTGHIHKLKQGEDSYEAAYKAGLASGKEEGYRRGYREGFADCIEFGSHARSTTAVPDTASDTSKKTGDNRARLRGLPCANCGCPSYSDEVKCPRCGTLKTAKVGEQSGEVEGV